MIDTTTREPLQVSTDGGEWSYITLPLMHLDEVRALLDANKVSYAVDDEVLSLDGKPEVAFISLRRGTDPAMVQSLLDSIP
jgi:hypothetical protein